MFLLLFWVASCGESGERDSAIDEMFSDVVEEGMTEFEIAAVLRSAVAESVDMGNVEDSLCDGFASISFLDFKLIPFLNKFLRSEGVAKCGLTAAMLAKVLNNHGIEAYTYNFGVEGTAYTHVVVLASTDGYFTVHDPYVNYSVTDSVGIPKSVNELFFELSSKRNGNIVLRTDTVLRDINLVQVNDRWLNSLPACVAGRLAKELGEFTNGVIKVPVCAGCEVFAFDCPEFGFLTFADTVTETPPAFLSQIGTVWGPKPLKMQWFLDSIREDAKALPLR